MKEIKLKTKSKVEDGLLVAGVPFGERELSPNGEIELLFNNKILPLWWEERSYWPDGSVKWIFLHTRVPEGENDLILKVTGKTRREFEKVKFEGGYLRVGKVALRVKDSSWSFETSQGSWSLLEDNVYSKPKLKVQSIQWEVALVEDSPISPLIRLRPKKRKEGLLLDYLLRLDPAGNRLIWQRRMTWQVEGKFYLNSAWATLIPEESLNKKGSLLILSPGKVKVAGDAKATDYPEGRWNGKNHSLWVEKAWQRGPLCIEWDKETIKLSFYPENVEPLPVLGGTSFRHIIHLACGSEAQKIAGYEVRFIIDPIHLCKSKALGILTPAEEIKKDFPGFEKSFKATFEYGRLSRLSTADKGEGLPVPLEEESKQDSDYFGLQHYGDWPMPWGAYGGKRRMYADNEYDVAYAYFQAYACYGDWRFMEIARHSAIHMSDVDYISTTGDMRFHSYSEVAEDHGHRRSSSGDFGHYWTDGYWILYFFFGDVWARESAEKFTEYLVGLFERRNENFKRSLWAMAERHLGWPIVALMGTYEATGNKRILKCIQKIVAYIYKFTSNPDREIEEERGTKNNPVVWWRTAMEDGCKPFMVGIIMEGLERYYRVSQDKLAAESLINLANFLVDKMWLSHQCTFIYEWNAYNRPHRFIISYDLTALFIRGIGYAYQLTGDKKFQEISEKAFYALLWTLYHPSSGGKAIGYIGRSLCAYVAMLKEWVEEDYKEYCRLQPPSTGKEFIWKGSIKSLINSGKIILGEGSPIYKDESLLSNWESYVESRFKRPVATDKGEIELWINLNKGSSTWLNQRCFLHLCDEVHTKSCISLIIFYQGLHLRIYDKERRLIEVPEVSIRDWKEGEWYKIKVVWESPGKSVIYINDKEADKKFLDRSIGGHFTRLCIGYKPGNWRAWAKIKLVLMKFSKVGGKEKNDAWK